MDSMGIASVAKNMKAMQLQTEAAFKVMKMAMDITEEAGAALMKMIDVAVTGVGKNIDMTV